MKSKKNTEISFHFLCQFNVSKKDESYPLIAEIGR